MYGTYAAVRINARVSPCLLKNTIGAIFITGLSELENLKDNFSKGANLNAEGKVTSSKTSFGHSTLSKNLSVSIEVHRKNT